jgi:hypothetical protein
MPGILISISTRSKRPVAAASTASAPSPTASLVQPNISQSVAATSRLVALSSTISTCSAPPAASAEIADVSAAAGAGTC